MKKTFKSLFLILLASVLVFTLLGCEKSCEKDPNQEKCQVVEKTCEEDPTQEKCQVVEKTCEEDPTQEKCKEIDDPSDIYPDHTKDEVVDAHGGKYKEGTVVEKNALIEGVKHTKYTAETSAPFVTYGASVGLQEEADELYPQVVNVLEVPNNTQAKLITWTYANKIGWVKATVENFAKNFEYNNPGWRVIAAVNGDFFDINGLGNLQYQTSGVSVCNGEVVRPISSAVTIGFTNDGTKQTMIANQPFTTTENHMLALYDEEGNITKTFEIAKINEAPGQNETAVYYCYPTSQGNATTSECTMPGNNAYLCTRPERILPMDGNNLYAKGPLEKITEAQEMSYATFGIVTNNPEVQAAIDASAMVRVQRDVTGAYAGCENITGGALGYDSKGLIENGIATESTDTARHPRTMVGVRADGTIILVTVDGRQAANDMYGVVPLEMSALMLKYGCISAYNLDGGGSTTMIIREGENFRVLNSPSDGSARLDSNCILVVVPEIALEITNLTDKELTLSIPKFSNNLTVDNIRVNINGKEYQSNDKKIVIPDLKPETIYEFNYTYDITYEGNTKTKTSDNTKILTGKKMPDIKDFTATKNIDGSYTINLEMEDSSQVIDQMYIRYGRKTKFIEEYTSQTIQITDNVDDEPFILMYNCQIMNNPQIIQKIRYSKAPSTVDATFGSSKKMRVGDTIKIIIPYATDYENDELTYDVKISLTGKDGSYIYEPTIVALDNYIEATYIATEKTKEACAKITISDGVNDTIVYTNVITIARASGCTKDSPALYLSSILALGFVALILKKRK